MAQPLIKLADLAMNTWEPCFGSDSPALQKEGFFIRADGVNGYSLPICFLFPLGCVQLCSV